MDKIRRDFKVMQIIIISLCLLLNTTPVLTIKIDNTIPLIDDPDYDEACILSQKLNLGETVNIDLESDIDSFIIPNIPVGVTVSITFKSITVTDRSISTSLSSIIEYLQYH